MLSSRSMAPRPRNQGPIDDAATRQLGLGFSFDAPAPPVSLPDTDTDTDTRAGGPAVRQIAEAATSLSETTARATEDTAVTIETVSLIGMPQIVGLDRARRLPSAESTPAPEAVRPPRVFSVFELVRAARLMLESRFAEVRVEGEVSGFKRSGPGHIYFCLKDDHAALDCVMYAREAARLRFRVEDGMAVRLRGRLTIYEGRGRFQMTVAEIEPTGAGALAVAFEQLKQKLEAAGLFAPARKRRLPFLPRRLGVVTSPQGAVIRDIIHVAHRRFPIAILLAPTPVQGPGAAASIVAALERLAAVSDVDAIIVARGGGSIEDLWSFNEEEVARAIAACRVPVISGVGHDTDFTIADFVADVRAPTPSAAAELAVPVMSELRATVMLLGQRAGRGLSVQLRHARLMLERGRVRLGDPRRLCDERRQLVDDLAARAHRSLLRRISRARSGLAAAEVALARVHPHRRIASQRASFAVVRGALEAAARVDLQHRRRHLELLRHKLEALSPRRVLDRGYSLAFDDAGHVLTDAARVAPGDRIVVALRAGTVAARVIDVAAKASDG